MSAVPPIGQQQNPYPGLQPFQERDKERFFGRDEEIHILTDKILANRLTLLVAASGVGKSSLLQAGVMPALHAGGMADLIYYNDWVLDPLTGLKNAVVKHLIDHRRIGSDYRPDAPDQALDQFLRIHSLLAEGMLVILLDQFEEFFYYHRFSRQRDRFVQQLAAAVRDAETPAVFVFSMREDFAMELSAFKPHLRSVFDTVYRIEKLKPNAARLAIEQPAQALGVTYQAELIERLLNDLGSRERENTLSYDDAPLLIEPPHLQIVCRELWQQAAPSEDRCIGLSHYDSLGGAKRVLESYFQHKIRSLTGEQQRLASRAFDHLVSQHGAKMAYPLQELAERIGENPPSLQATLDLLHKAAILRRVERQGQPWYELYHDIFAQSINAWNRGYKERELRKRLLRRGAYALLAGASGWLVYNGYINHHDRHLRIGKQTVSERIETYRGALDRTDVFNQQKFLFEADFEWLDLEADKRFEQSALSDLRQDQAFQIGLLPLRQRFIAYARNGLYQKAFKVADNMRTSKDAQLLDHLIEQLPDVRADSVLGQLDKIRKADKNNAELSKSVIAALVSLNGRSAVKLLIEELQNTEPSVRTAAIEALVQLQAESAIPPLIERLKDDNVDVRKAVIEALVQLQAESAIPPLIERLKDENADVRKAAIEALVQLKADPAIVIPPLIDRLKDDDKLVQQAAIKTLVQMKADPAIVIPPLIEWLKDVNPFAPYEPIEALVQLNADPAIVIPPLIDLLKDENQGALEETIKALVHLKVDHAIVIPQLIERLKDGNANVKQTAITALVQMKAESAIPHLIERLKDVDPYVRRATIEALVQLKAESAVGPLVERFKDDDLYVQSAAIDALVQLKAESAVPSLIERLKEGHPDVQRAAIKALAQLKAESAIYPLIERLNDDDMDVQQAAINALGQLQAASAIPALIERLKDDIPTVQEAAINVLVQLKAKSAIPPLIERLEDDNSNVRRAAIEALGQLQATSAVPTLIERLKGDVQYVRQATIEALVQLKAESSLVPLLIKWLNDTDATVRQAAIQTLVQLKPESAVEPLIERLKDTDADVRRVAIEALDQLQAESAVAPLIERLKDDDSDVRWAAIEALVQLKADSAVEPLIEQLKDENAAVRWKAIEALAQLQAESAVAPLIERLKDTGATVRQAAIEALVQLKAESAVEPLIERLKDEDADVQRAAIKALSQLKAESAVPILIEQMKDDDWVAVAIEALAQLKAVDTIPLLIEKLADTSEYVRMAALESLGEFGAKQAAPALLKLLTEDKDAGVKQTAAKALSRMRSDVPELSAWQAQQLVSLAEQLTSASSEQKATIADNLGFIYHAKSVEMLVSLLADAEDDVVIKVLAALGGIGAYHPEWLKPQVDRLLELSKQSNPKRQNAAVAAIGQLLSFAGGAPESGLGNDESRLREHLSALAKEAKTTHLRAAAIDALGACGRPACAEILSALLQGDQAINLRFSLTHWLAWLHTASALPALKRQLDDLVNENQAWREQRDEAMQQAAQNQNQDTEASANSTASADPPVQSENILEEKKTEKWQKEAQVFQAAYAIAAIDPADAGIALLNHPLHAAREAAIQALAGRADGELIKKLVAAHQAFAPDDLPSPLPYALFRALDKALHTVEYTGTADDLKILQAIKGKGIETPMKTQEKAINERIDWTLAELQHRFAAKPAEKPVPPV